MVKLYKAPPPENVYGCKRYSGAAAGDLVKRDAKVAAVGDMPIGIIVDELPTDNPPEMLNAYGNGAIIDMTGATGWSDANPGLPVFSDGDGTISTTKPNPGVGNPFWIVGYTWADAAGTTPLVMIAIQVEMDEVA